MPTIKIEYDPVHHAAIISPKDDCPEKAWSNVRRLFEERYPELVGNRFNTLSIPWWAMLSMRDALRYVFRAYGVTSLEISNEARKLLLKAKERSNRFSCALELRKIRSESEIETALPTVGFERRLFPYQLRNVTQLSNLPAGATFSVPGAGKTSEALAYYFLIRESADRLLVIAPKNAFVAWEDELPDCVPSVDFEFIRLTGGISRIQEILSSNPIAVIISYHQLPSVMNPITQYMMQNDVFMFIDESHRMKRGTAGVHGSSILKLSHLPKRKLILSGTPMPNSSADLVAQFNFLYPENANNHEQVIDKLRRVFVRTTKSELDLTPPVRLLKEIPMKQAQEQLYSALASDAERHLQELNSSDRLRFRRIARCVQYMLQAASNPSLLASSSISEHPLLSEVISEGISAKLEYACDLTRKWVGEGNKVVIWSTFVGTVEHLSGLLADIGAHFIHGSVITSDDPDVVDSRETKIRDFNTPDSSCRVLIANPAACSEGISLHHVCHRAIYIDRNYNAAQYLQSEDRIHRIGLDRSVETYITILSSPGTIDESVDRRLQAKVQAMQVVLNDPDLSIHPLDLDTDDDADGLDVSDIEDIRRMLRVST